MLRSPIPRAVSLRGGSIDPPKAFAVGFEHVAGKYGQLRLERLTLRRLLHPAGVDVRVP